jgi:hypothetical protein
MPETDYKAILEAAKTDLATEQNALGDCLKRQETHEKKISGLRATIAALSRMLDVEFVEEDALGLTDAIRQVFKSIGTRGNLTAVEVKGKLELLGFDTRKYGNLMASVHTILNRLANSGFLRPIGTRGGENKVCYQWAGTDTFYIEESAPKQTTGHQAMTLGSGLNTPAKKD